MGEIDISVVIPCYNALQRGADIAACVQSALEQDIKGLEVIAIDDGSTDGTGGELDALAATRPMLRVVHKENGGVSSARNAGADIARGKWVSFLDIDDRMEKNGLRTLIDAVKEQDDIICGAYTVIYTDEGERTQLFIPAHGEKQAVLESLIRTDSALNSMCARLYRRSFLKEKALRAPVGIRIGEDVLFNLWAFYHARAYTLLDASVYRYNLGGKSAMGEAGENFFAAQKPMLAGIDAFLRETGLKDACFRAQMDTILRQLRRGYGRWGAAPRFSRAARHALEGVHFEALGRKEKMIYLIARHAGVLSAVIS